MGMTSPDTVYHEVLAAFPVILPLVFMVAGIYFMKELLLFTFTKVLLSIPLENPHFFSVLLYFCVFVSVP